MATSSTRRIFPIESVDTPRLHTSEKEGGFVLDCRPYRARIQQLLEEKELPSISDTERFLLEAELLFHAMPEPLRRAVCEFKSGLGRYPFLILSGLPRDSELPPTPANSRRPALQKTLVGELLCAILCRALGEPFGYLQQNEGELFQNNSPVKLHERAQSGESSLEELFFHTDGSFHPMAPDFVVLCCLRADPERQAVTSFSSLKDILAQLTPRQREVLTQPRFLSDGVEYDYDQVGERGNRAEKVALVRGTPEDPFLFYDQDIHRPTDEESADAMRALDAAMEAQSVNVRLEAGDIALFDNRRSIHKRSPFQAHYDGRDRWCLLNYVSGNRLETSTLRRIPGHRRILDLPARLPEGEPTA